MGIKNIKPPLIGINPKYVFDLVTDSHIRDNGGVSEQWVKQNKKNRLEELKSTIERYFNANRHVNSGWISEYNDLLTELGVKQNIFKL